MKKKTRVKKIIITALIIVITVFIIPFAYSEYHLISHDYTKAGDIIKIIKVNNDSDYEVLRTIRDKNGEDVQVVVAKDLSEFTALVRAEYVGSSAVFKLSDGRLCHMTHQYKSAAFCGKVYNYNIFTFTGANISELLADDNRICK